MKHVVRLRHTTFICGTFILALLCAPPLHAQTPEWIWHDNKGAAPADGEVRFFRKNLTIDGEVSRATISVAGDDEAQAYVNGRQVANSRGWNQPSFAGVATDLKNGQNLLAIRGKNNSSAAAVLLKLELTFKDGRKETVATDTSWASFPTQERDWNKPEFDASSWTKVVSLGKLGVEPWGDVLKPREATPVDALKVADGFKIELLRSSAPGEGSWVGMTVDNKGRLIISPQGSEPMLRVSLDANGLIARIETIDLPVSGAMGLLYAFDSLYVNGQGKDGYHLYRLRDTNGDDQYDAVELLRKWKGGPGEHGAHGIVLGPDKKLYIVCGNFVDVPEDILPSSPHKNYADDLVLPRAEDGNGFGAGRKPPGGYVVRLDPDGKNAELFASGQRNTYDIAFNADGELFGFDSDMEWDWGNPWYRPIRINHIVSGGDYGFREGTAKWPNWYQDSLPTTVDIGIGSPTGVGSGTGAKFPAKYQKAIYAMDWSYGRIVAVHLTPQGATYTGTFENFVAPRALTEPSAKKAPLNVTDLEIGADGAMYFLTGGRGTQSGLYRVSYPNYTVGETAVAQRRGGPESMHARVREIRHELEAFHGKQDPKALDFAWPYLNSDDRWIRYASRLVIESQPVDSWKDRALAESKAEAALTALLALARLGGKDSQAPLLKALAKFPLDNLFEEQKLEKLRVVEVSFARQGRPSAELQSMAIEKLSRQYPARTWPLNKELSQLLVYLEAPDVVSKTLGLLDAAPTQEEQIHYIFTLRHLKSGWTMEQRRHYFEWCNKNRAGLSHLGDTMKWFKDAGREYADGASFPKFMANIRKDAVASLTDNERGELASLIVQQPTTAQPVPRQRSFVKEWKMEDLTGALEQVGRGRNFERGRQAYVDAQCAACHKFGNEGGANGPELTAAASKYTRRDILESILEPSKIVSEQYQNTTIIKKDGDDVTGRILEDNDQRLVVLTDPLKNTKIEVRKADIEKRQASKLSPMPEGLANVLSKDEILDLIAYIESGGKSAATAFAK